MADVFLGGLACVYVITSQLFLRRPDFHLINICVAFGAGAALFTTSLLSFTWAKDVNSSVAGINELITLERQLVKKYGFRLSPSLNNHQKRVGIFMHFIVSGAAVLPVGIIVANLYEDLDSFYFIFEDILSPYPKYYRETSTMFGLILIRLVLVGPSIFEACRTLTLLGMACMGSIESFKVCLRILTHNIHHFQQFRFYNSQLLIIFKGVQKPTQDSLLIGVSVIFLLTIEMLWVCMKGYSKVQLLLYSTFLFVLLLLLGCIFLFLPEVTGLEEACINLVKKHIHRVRMRKSSLIECKQANALVPIKLKVGNFQVVTKSLKVGYLATLVEQFFTAILLIDF
ncbi:unnamed protein product [Orchesella dallaii]|uniref:Odorant receptor n=1 Tax=Orchesella dallaii TaxID=48710 RepID=A0ABP1QPY3_9HEXA